MQERDIIEMLISRDENGMNALLVHYGPLMRYIISPILRDAHDAEDCLSEAAMRVWDKIELFNPNCGSWTAWLTAVTRNAALNYVRKSSHYSETEEIPETIPSPDPTPEEVLIRKERQAALNRALEQLASRDRALFYRKYYYMQSTSQIASELGMTERAVEGKLYRLKKQLRKKLGGDLND